MSKIDLNEVTDKIANQVKLKGFNKSMKVKTLLGLYNYGKRTEEITTIITELLADRNVVLNPSIMKLGETWQLMWDDRVYLSLREECVFKINEPKSVLSIDLNREDWFNKLLIRNFRNEREVETKFIIPLLSYLGYFENDRYDGMPVEAYHGSKKTRLETDFALFNIENEIVEKQVLLVVEAKMEKTSGKCFDLVSAQKQLKSYAIWFSCSFGLVTDSKIIQVLDLMAPINGMKIIFECKREELKDRFTELYSLISKEKLTNFYETKMR